MMLLAVVVMAVVVVVMVMMVVALGLGFLGLLCWPLAAAHRGGGDAPKPVRPRRQYRRG